MDKNEVIKKLKALHVCPHAIEFVSKAGSLEFAWEIAEINHIIWLIFRVDPSMKRWELLLEILRGIEHLMTDERSKAVIAALERYIASEAVDCVTVAHADAAFFAARAAHVAHADAAYIAAYAAYAAAANSAVDCADCADAAAADANFAGVNVREIIRRQYTLEEVLKLLKES